MTHYQTPPSRGNILIVDDVIDNLRVLSAVLSKHGFEVRKARDGQQAIASVYVDLPEVILLDIRMPEMDGYEVCQVLKADPTTREVPIIFISALDDIFDKVKAFSIGGADYITKPFQEAEVIARVENQLRLHRLQKQLHAQNEELARSNQELEQFAYVVSHDLQQPLQSITGFAKLMLLKDQQTLSTSAIDYLNRIVDAGGRMQRLIQDLLGYAQVGKQTQIFEWIDCNEILQQAMNNLRMAIAENHVQLTCNPLPKVLGNETQLLQLFQNLIGNAIKFTQPDVSPTIEISATAQPDHWLFSIRDNGIGMGAEDLKRIFEVFQRAHLTQKYPGSGIGLATCKKIVECHKGKIWAESQPNVGTTFYFTLTSKEVIDRAP
jgi:light-regulated signal transduction histidine kinase (bacteriophytochrome)